MNRLQMLITATRRQLSAMECGEQEMDAARYHRLMGWIAGWQAELGYDF